ncbi:MAG: 23S rRNA (adenine(2503)-C(2))-methyltransferase RlmN [Clostridia bacterium]|nr:23S rRNA (adenine(2503)-C(2))-methyltransferase RlmN [Clostridia bacterium]
MKLLTDLTLSELKELMAAYGEPSFRAEQLYLNLYAGKDFPEMTNIGKGLKERLAADGYLAVGVTILEHYVSREDGTVKFLFSLSDGNIVEGVLMRYKYGNTLCVSTQVGCRMNCAFCASGLEGLKRNLTAGEILGEVIAANRYDGGNASDRKITNVVLMGSGEPLDNYDNVVKFLRLVNAEKGLNISYRNISLSTCGLIDAFDRFLEENIPVTMTFSLHAALDEVRSSIMPVNKRYGVDKVVDASKRYFARTSRRVVFEYSLIKGVNDRDEDAAALIAAVKGFPCVVNLIVLNYVKERGLSGTSRKDAYRFASTLEKGGVSATVRRTLGADIEGACGQLRAKYIKKTD